MDEERYLALIDLVEESALQVAALAALVKALAMTLPIEQRSEARRLLMHAFDATQGPAQAKLRKELGRISDLLL